MSWLFEVPAEKITKNSVKCLECNDEIESVHRHDFKFCKCGNVAVDGGIDYRKRLFKNYNYEETSVFESVIQVYRMPEWEFVEERPA